jgi:hypothetical protein
MYCSYKDIDSLYLSGGFFFSFFFFSNFFTLCQLHRFFFLFLFFGSKFRLLAIIIISGTNPSTENFFFWKKWHNFFALFLSFKKKLNLADLDHSFHNVAKYSGIPKKIRLCSFACSQTWQSSSSGESPVYLPHKFPIKNKIKSRNSEHFQKGIYSVWRQVPKYLSKHFFLKFF